MSRDLAHWLDPHLAGMHILRGGRRVQSVRLAVAILELVCGLARLASGFHGACGTGAGGQRAAGTARGPPVMLSAACTATNAAVLVQAHARTQRAHTPEQVHLD